MHHHKPAPRPCAAVALRGLAVLASVLACAVGGLTSGSAAQAASHASSATSHPGWTKVPSPSQAGTSGSALRGVSAVSATDAWAVGCGPLLILHWNGIRWTRVPSPNPGGNTCLDSVSAVSATDAWAAGYVIGSTGITRTVILHWDGKSWKQVTSPSPGGIYNVLYGVSAVSATDAWAVGSYAVSPSSPGYSLILHWNGQSWTKVPSPSPCKRCQPDITLRGVSAVSATDAWAAGYNTGGNAAQPLILHWDGKSWTRVRSPSPGATISTYLLGVAATSAANAWAVGYYHTAGLNALPFLLRWNGKGWTRVRSPRPGGTAGSTAPDAVSALSPSGAWTVGSHSTGGIGVHSRTLALHWNGTRWTQVPSPSAGGTTSTYLLGVAALSPADAWAVGYDGLPVILHWNGKTWTKVPSPGSAIAPGHNATSNGSLSGLSAVSATDVWAVGDASGSSGSAPLVLRWNGTRWSKVPSPNPGGGLLTSVSAASAADAWAVGGYTTGSTANSLTLHWNGTRWKRVASPSPGGSTGATALYSVTTVSAADAWAAGYYDTTPGGTEHALLLHWDGKSWTQVTSPAGNTEYTNLTGVSAVSATDAWAVGWEAPKGGNARPLTLHWNGTSWTQVHSPNPGQRGFDTILRGVSAVSATNVWAVGNYTAFSGSGPASLSLTMHWNGTSWKRVASPSPGGTSGYSTSYSVSADSAADGWAVGVFNTGGGGSDELLAAHWNGKSWTEVPSLVGGTTSTSLSGVTAISPADAWAVGSEGSLPVILHWNGKSWAKVPSLS